MNTATENRRNPGLEVSGPPTSIRHIMFIGGFALAAFMGIGSLTWPMSDDHLHYGFVGDTIMAGGVPYRDAWDLKGPLTYYIYGWVRMILGHDELSIRIFDLAVAALFCQTLWLLVRRLGGNRVFGASLAVLMFLLHYFDGNYYWTAQPDDWGGMLMLVTVSLLTVEMRNGYLPVAAAAIMLSLAILLKPTYVIFIPLLLLRPVPRRLLTLDNIRQFGAGVFLIGLCVSTVYFWVFRHGGFQDLIDALVFVNAAYGGLTERVSLPRILNGLHWLYALGLIIPYMLVPVALWVISRGGAAAQTRLLATWFALAITMLGYQGVYYPYEFMPATISAIVIIGVAINSFCGWNVSSIIRPAVDGALFLIVGAISLAPQNSGTVFGAVDWPGYVLGRVSSEEYLPRISEWWDRRYAVQMLAVYLSTHTRPDDKVQYWGNVSGLGAIMLSNRKVATRFGDTWAVMTNSPVKGHYRRVFLREVSSSLPRCIFVDTNHYFSKAISSFPEFDWFIHRYYEHSGIIGEYQIWTLRRSANAK